MATPSLRLAQHKLFKTPSRTLTETEMIQLAYDRARVAAQEYGISPSPVCQSLSEKICDLTEE